MKENLWIFISISQNYVVSGQLPKRRRDINTLGPRQNWPPFSRRHFQMHFREWKCIDLVSQKFVFKGPINNIPALVQIVAWDRPGDKPLSGPVMISLLTHICAIWPQWVNLIMVDKYYWCICAPPGLNMLILWYRITYSWVDELSRQFLV